MDSGLGVALRFKREHVLAAAERVAQVRGLPGGLALTTPSLHHVHEPDVVVAPVACGAARIAAACARLGLLKARLDGASAAVELPPGWTVDRELVMVRRRPPSRGAAPWVRSAGPSWPHPRTRRCARSRRAATTRCAAS